MNEHSFEKKEIALETGERSSVTVIGMGPMGQSLAGAFLKNGHLTTVWNRTAAKAEALVAQGATLAQSVRDAIEASSLIVICVLDYHAVEAILGQQGEALKGRTLVNLTADSPDRARAMAAWASERGIDYLDGAIMTPTPTIGTSAAVVLYSGTESVYVAHQPTLSSIGGTASYLGEDHGRAAAFDVSLLDLFWTTMSGYTHALALARAENISPKEFAAYAQGIVAILPDIFVYMADDVAEGSYPGEKSNIASAATGIDHIIHAAGYNGIDASVLSAARGIAQQAIDAGYGNEGFSRLTDLLRNPFA